MLQCTRDSTLSSEAAAASDGLPSSSTGGHQRTNGYPRLDGDTDGAAQPLNRNIGIVTLKAAHNRVK
jgi:hypothetical protein